MEVRQVLARLMVLEEEERGALAARLHDGPVQDLLATRYLLDLTGLALRRSGTVGGGGDTSALLARVGVMREGAQDALAGSRAMLGALTARCTDGSGLPAALQAAAEAVAAAGLSVTVHSAPSLERLPAATAVLAWRWAQAVLADAAERRTPTATLTASLVEGGPTAVSVQVVIEAPCEPDLSAPAVVRWLERVRLAGGAASTTATGASITVPMLPLGTIDQSNPTAEA